LFESVEGGETWGRYSIIGLPCNRRFEVSGSTFRVRHLGKVISETTVDDPLAAIAQLQSEYRVPRLPELPIFTGGLVGYFGYECVRFIEPRLACADKPDQIGTDDIVLLESDEVAVFDNLAGRLFLVVHANPDESDAWEQAQRRLDQLSHRLRFGSPGYERPANAGSIDEADFEFGFSKDDFISAVNRSKQYILEGDIFQVVLSQRMSVPFSARPVDVYRALRALNPSPYMFFVDLGDTQIVGSSPEVMVRVMNGEMMLRPIAGTRHRGATPEADQLLAEELINDPKERAEHLMLIDLGRNDAGRACQTGTVQVTDNMVIERYSHVMHIVSQVQGKLQEGLGSIDAIRASFPAGTLSGAPKIRAMEIINELEPVKRNIYAGAVGYLGWHDNADLAIAIRTAVIRGGKLYVQAGAGIVADSDPEKEWEESMNKGRALITAVSHAAEGL
jgi:anthranilate synthase component 1